MGLNSHPDPDPGPDPEQAPGQTIGVPPPRLRDEWGAHLAREDLSKLSRAVVTWFHSEEDKVILSARGGEQVCELSNNNTHYLSS